MYRVYYTVLTILTTLPNGELQKPNDAFSGVKMM